MCPVRKTNLAALLLAILYSTVIIYGCKNLYADEKGEIKHFIVEVGFGIWQFDKIK